MSTLIKPYILTNSLVSVLPCRGAYLPTDVNERNTVRSNRVMAFPVHVGFAPGGTCPNYVDEAQSKCSFAF